jgi:hypothetical protein
MKTITATELARNLRRVLDRVVAEVIALTELRGVESSIAD